jgi:hypothetical protein
VDQRIAAEVGAIFAKVTPPERGPIARAAARRLVDARRIADAAAEGFKRSQDRLDGITTRLQALGTSVRPSSPGGRPVTARSPTPRPWP